MFTDDFDYDLPPELIAQTPVEPRDAARLLVLDRSGGGLQHKRFRELGDFLHPGDLLVLNQTRVIPARLYAHKIPTGGRVEVLLLNRRDALNWEALVGGKGLLPGKRIQIEDGPAAEIVSILEGARRVLRFEKPVETFLNSAGHIPLPPYIQEKLDDPERYQTVYARLPGSVAAPTAGLHFTQQLIERLEGMGVRLAYVTLHVGLDTFAPVHEANPKEHAIHTEWCQVSKAAAQAVNETLRSGGRVVAVGTTSVRTLESAARFAADGDAVAAFDGPTDLFILPGYRFRVVGAMVTNFHLPRTTLIMLVSAFAGRERVLAAYQEAKQQGYRFYSFGDAMLIV